MRRLNLGKRGFHRNDECLRRRENVCLVGMGKRVDGAQHLATCLLALGALEKRTRPGGASRDGDRHTATLLRQSR